MANSLNINVNYYPQTMVRKPWGYCKTIEDNSSTSNSYKVKLISINKGEKLPKHCKPCITQHLSIVQGSAKINVHVEKEFEYYKLSEKEYTFLPNNTMYTIENVGDNSLEIVVTQFGNFLENVDHDDICKIPGGVNWLHKKLKLV